MISKKLFTGDGTTNRFLSEFIIKSVQFARPYCFVYDNSLATDGSEDALQNPSNVWSFPDNLYRRGNNIPKSEDLVTVDKWNVVDNSVLFYSIPPGGSSVWVEVATTAEEFGDTLIQPTVQEAIVAATLAKAKAAEAVISAAVASASETAAAISEASASLDAAATAADLVATNADVVSTNADKLAIDTRLDTVQANTLTVEANLSAITSEPIATQLANASTNATNTQLQAWEAEAERMTADSYATEAEDVVVKTYTSNGDGTFTATNTTEYSSLHWAAKSEASAEIPRTPTPTLSGLATVIENADLVVTITNYDATYIYTEVTTSGTAARVGDTITITAGSVDVDTGYTLTVTAQAPLNFKSLPAVHNFTVQDAPFIPDVDAYIDVTGAGFNDTNFPTSEYGTADGSLDSEGELIFDAITYTGNGTSQDIVTGIDSVDFTVASNGSGYYHYRDAVDGDCYVVDESTEKITNGTLDTDLSGFTTSGSPTWVGGEVQIDASDQMFQSFTTVIGTTYRYSINNTFTSGSLYISVGNDTIVANRYKTLSITSSGNKALVFTATATTTYLQLWGNSGGCNALVDNLSIKEISASGTAVVNTSKVHVKNRDVAYQNIVIDGLRGITKNIRTDETREETVDATNITALNSDGFTVGASAYTNQSTKEIISYQTQYTHIKWGTTNQSKKYIEAYNPITNEGMIIYEGSGTTGHEIPHSVGSEIDMAFQKNLGRVVSWHNYTKDVGVNNTSLLDTSAAFIDGSTTWGDSTSSAITVEAGNWVNENNSSHIMYYKAKSPTWSTGTYIGTGAAGNFIETRDSNGELRKPARVTVKSISAGGTYYDWAVIDNRRDTSDFIALNLSASEETSLTSGGITQGGFTLPDGALRWNATGVTYLYMVEFDTKASALEAGGSYSFDEALYQSATVTKSDAEGDWNGTQADSFVTSSLPNVMDSVVYGTVDSVPLLTSNTSNGIAFASQEHSGSPAFHAFNNTLSTDYGESWFADFPSNQYIGYIYGVGIIIDKITINGTPSNLLLNRAMKTFRIEASLDTTDGTDGVWVTVRENEDSGSWSANEVREYIFTNSTKYIAYRVFIVDNNGDANYTGLGELELIEATGDIILEGEVLATDELYLGDGTDFETVTATGATYDAPTDKTTLTHGQTFTPTFACNKDNVSMDVSFDGTNYNTLTKSSAVVDSYVSPTDFAIKELHAEYQEATNTGTDLAFKINHKEQDTKTSAVYAALLEGA